MVPSCDRDLGSVGVALSEDDPGLAPTIRFRRESLARDETHISVEPAMVVEGTEAYAADDLAAKFELQEELGRGGMGRVVVGFDRRLRRNVAIKMLASKHRENATSLRRFIIEAQVAAQLEHPNICPFYSLERTEEGSPALTMKLVEGLDFAKYIKACRAMEKEGERAPPYDLATRIEYLLRACDAIAYAHGRGVIHRDLKPSNLMLGPYNEVYVMDWGLARVMTNPTEDDDVRASRILDLGDGKPAMTRVGQVVGTPAYMPPEQAQGESADAAADQYALGMVLFELATLKRPRTGRTVAEVMSLAKEGERETAEPVGGRPVDGGLVAIIDRSTDPDPERRYPSVSDFADDLRRWLRREELAARPDSPVQRAWRWLSRNPGRVFMVLAVVVIGLLALVVSSLYELIDEQQASARRNRTLTALTGQVSRIGRRTDTNVRSLEALVGELAITTRDALRRSPNEGVLRSPSFFRTDEGANAVVVPRYGATPVSFDHAVTVMPSDALDTTRPSVAPIGSALTRRMKEILLRSMQPLPGAIDADHLLLLEPTEQREALVRGDSAMAHSAIVALESGVLVAFPGTGAWGEDDDHRSTDWYREGVATRGTHWGTAFADPAGGPALLPCYRPIYDVTGKRLGLAVLTLDLDRVRQGLEQRHGERLPQGGWRNTWFLRADGTIVLGSDVSASTIGRPPPAPRRLDEPAVQSAIGALEKEDANDSGYVVSGESLFVYDRMEALPWVLVMEVEADRYLED